MSTHVERGNTINLYVIVTVTVIIIVIVILAWTLVASPGKPQGLAVPFIPLYPH